MYIFFPKKIFSYILIEYQYFRINKMTKNLIYGLNTLVKMIK